MAWIAGAGFFTIQMYLNYQKRKQIDFLRIKKGEISESSSGVFHSAGLSTLLNAMTQTTTTLCANGQCFQIGQNVITSNLAAFGVSVTSIDAYLIPLCCLLLAYSLWSLYKEKRDFWYKPFQLGLAGCVLIVLDNFVISNYVNIYNVLSWTGNGMLIAAAIWASREQAQEFNPFGV